MFREIEVTCGKSYSFDGVWPNDKTIKAHYYNPSVKTICRFINGKRT